MKIAFQSALAAATLLAPFQAFAAYRCELFDRAPNAPGGDVPVAVYFSNSGDVNIAKAACSAKLDRVSIIDYWLKWLPENQLPANWQEHDLLASGTTPGQPAPDQPAPSPAPQPEPAPYKPRGYACFVYNKPANVPGGDIAYETFYSDHLNLPVVKAACIQKMRTLLPNSYRDFEVRYLDGLPLGWSKKSLFAQPVSPTDLVTGEPTLDQPVLQD